MEINKRHQILLVDDDHEYTYLIEEALKVYKPQPVVNVLHNGADLLAWLETSERPSLILLDINMPAINGFEVLEKLKKEGRYKGIPVVMLTVSENRDDVIKCYDIGVNAYVTKPMTFDQLVSRMEVLSRYWFGTAETPDKYWSQHDDFL